MRVLEETKRWIGEITEIFLLLIALGVAVEILFGRPAPFMGGVVANLTALLSTLGENGMVGLSFRTSLIFVLEVPLL